MMSDECIIMSEQTHNWSDIVSGYILDVIFVTDFLVQLPLQTSTCTVEYSYALNISR